MADPFSFADVVDEPAGFAASGPVGAAISSSRAKAAQLEIQQQRLAQQQEHTAVQDTLDIHRSAVNDAKAYYDLAKSTTDMATDAAQKLDAADFLSESQKLDHMDPQYDARVTALTAKYPLAANDPAVNRVMGVKDNARKTYMKSIEQGGAFEFEEDSPAFHKYVDTFKEVGDPNAARAAANTVKKNEADVRTAIQAGFITNDDLYEPDGSVKSDLHNEKGHLHYDKLLNLAASRQGETVGKPVKAEELQHQKDLEFLVKTADKADDEQTKRLRSYVMKRAADFEEKRSGGAPSGTAPDVRNYIP